MITLPGPELARIQSTVRGVALLVSMEFTGGTQRVTTAPVSVVEGGDTYTALGGSGSVSQWTESADTGDDKVKLGITVANSAYLALALGSVQTYRNKRASIYLALFDDKFQLVGNKVLRWSGKMEKVNIRREENGGTVEMVCSRTGMPRSRVAQGLRMTDAQQQKLYPGDYGLQYVRVLIEKPAMWLSKKFQEI